MPARAGPSRHSLFPRQRRFSRRLLRPLSRRSSPTAPASLRCPIAAMPARAGSRASRACCGMPRRPMPSRRRDTARTASSSGAFRSAPASRWRWRPNSRSAKLILEAPYTSIADVAASAFPILPGPPRDAGSLPLRPAHRTGQGAAAVHAWRPRPDDPDRLLASACSRSRMSRNSSSGFPTAGTTISTILARRQRSRQFIGAARG